MTEVIQFSELNNRLLPDAPALLPSWVPNGKLVGSEYQAGNLQGDPGKSLLINVRTGKWKDFATGECGGDLISLYAAIHKLSQSDAARRLGDNSQADSFAKRREQSAKPECGVVTPVPPELGRHSCHHFKHGAPSMVWDYRNATGELLGTVARYDLPGGKAFAPWVAVRGVDGKTGWRTQSWPVPRPLYGLRELAERPAAPVLICEGEKSADAARTLCPDYVAISWSNGAQSWGKADWTPLRGRDVELWPDNDTPGIEAMQGLGELLRPVCRSVRIIMPENVPPKFDAADALADGWDLERFEAWATPLLSGLEAVAGLIRAADCAPGGGDAVAPANVAAGDETAPTVDLLRASDIKPAPIGWIWPGWLAAGKVHILGGAPGTGKTTIAMALAGTISTGGRWPDGSRSQSGNVVIWSGEDDPADTLVPRLALAGANLDRVFFIADVREGGKSRAFDPARDIDALHRKMIEVGDVKLLIVDPIVSAIAGDSHKNAEVRRGLQPLADLAAFMKCALLGVTHFSKGTGGRDPVERITGSLAFGAVARVVMVAAKHAETSDDGGAKRILLRAKSNIGPDDGGFEYEFQQADIESMPGVSASRVHWGGAIAGRARDLLAAAEAFNDEGDGDGARDDARQFLSDLLADGPQPVSAIKTEAKEAGHAWRTVERAKTALGVVAYKCGMKGGWQWSVSEDRHEVAKTAKQNSVAVFGKLGGLRDDADEVEVKI